MKLEDQVCSLESAGRLDELGVKQESIFVWSKYKFKNGNNKEWCINLLKDTGDLFNKYSAFTVAELGEMLPEWLTTKRNDGLYECSLIHSGGLKNNKQLISLWSIGEATEAEARALMLIYLLENKIITVEDLETPITEA